jgi:hypothetical protein
LQLQLTNGKNLEEEDASVKDPCGGGLFPNISLKDTTDPSKAGSFFLNDFKREFMCFDRYRKILHQLQVRAVVVQESRKSVCSSILLLGEKVPKEYVEGMP